MTDFAHLIGASVNWLEQYNGMPRLEVSMSITPSRDAYLYERHGSLYFAERWDGLASFFRDGLAGIKTYSSYPTIVSTRTDKIKVSNPIPLSAGEANQYGIGPYMDVVMLNRDRGYRQSGTITLELAKKAAHNIGVKLRCYTDVSGAITWHPWKREVAHKFERSHRLDT